MASLQTKWYSCCLLALLFFSFSAGAQINIMGRVVDDNGDIPLTGASVYFNNTTIGTYTNSGGDFHFELSNLLNPEMVISRTGYELLVYRLNAEQVKGKRIIFKLRAKATLEKEKLVLTAAIREKCLDIFSINFLGITKEAQKSRIENKSSVYFMEGGTKTSFVANADTPLVIINTMLGYKINFNLVEFWYDDATGENHLYGYARYEELGNDKKLIKNRLDCYYGSTLHFYRSLVSNQLYEQGFNTFLIQPVIDSIQQSLLSAEQAKAAAEIVTHTPITAPQILFIDSTNNFSIRGTGKLLVQYDKDPSAWKYLKRKNPMEATLDKGVESYIVFKTSPIGINYAGVLSDATEVEYSGFWMYEKTANSLPYDYKPD